MLISACAALFLSACGGLNVVPEDQLPTYQGDTNQLYLLTLSRHQEASGKVISAESKTLPRNRTREAGKPDLDFKGHRTGVCKPINLVDGWVVTQDCNPETGSSEIMHVTQASSGKSDKLKVYATDYKNGYLMAFLDTIDNYRVGWVLDSYVLNSRYFGFQLSDNRFLLFDRVLGRFASTAIDVNPDNLVYVDREGQPYIQSDEYGKPRGSIKKIEFPHVSFAAPLSPTEVFPASFGDFLKIEGKRADTQ
jgi:hypothetical protein